MKINFKTLAVGLLIAVAASVSVGAATPVISTYGTRNMMNMTADQLYRIALNANGSPQLSIQEKTDTGYVIGWQKKDKMFYEVLVVNSNGTYSSFSVVYPVKEKATYEGYCEHMKRSFVPTGVMT